jgi:hypothetical protein
MIVLLNILGNSIQFSSRNFRHRGHREPQFFYPGHNKSLQYQVNLGRQLKLFAFKQFFRLQLFDLSRLPELFVVLILFAFGRSLENHKVNQ